MDYMYMMLEKELRDRAKKESLEDFLYFWRTKITDVHMNGQVLKGLNLSLDTTPDKVYEYLKL